MTLNAGLRTYVADFSVRRLVTSTRRRVHERCRSPPANGAPVPCDSIVRPFRGGLAPRVARRRIRDDTILRGGYGINYNAAAYPSIAQQLAAQPPFANTATILATPSNQLLLQDALLNVTPGVTTNNYGVDPDYRLPFVQIYNADLQRNLTRTVTVDIAYTGTKGTDLDIVSAPNRNPDGTLRIPGVHRSCRNRPNPVADELDDSASANDRTVSPRAPVTHFPSRWTTRRRLAEGNVVRRTQDLGANGASTFVNGTGSTQRDPRSAVRRNKPWLTGELGAALLGNWQLTGSLQLASGTPFTARLSNPGDVATGPTARCGRTTTAGRSRSAIRPSRSSSTPARLLASRPALTATQAEHDYRAGHLRRPRMMRTLTLGRNATCRSR